MRISARMNAIVEILCELVTPENVNLAHGSRIVDDQLPQIPHDRRSPEDNGHRKDGVLEDLHAWFTVESA
jgi:hypothetical protein